MRYIISTLLFLISAPSFAQVAPDPTQFVQLALQVTEMVDKGQTAAVWDSSSMIMRSSTKRDQFTQITEQRRKIQGQIRNRQWEAIVQQIVAKPMQGVPAGRYLTVVVAGTNGAGVYVKEQVSFSLDTDNMWRIVGYTVSNQ
jgi:hypothetical protein